MSKERVTQEVINEQLRAAIDDGNYNKCCTWRMLGANVDGLGDEYRTLLSLLAVEQHILGERRAHIYLLGENHMRARPIREKFSEHFKGGGGRSIYQKVQIST
jgi:hypothetical protein